jgi:general secretion pathway protein D
MAASLGFRVRRTFCSPDQIEIEKVITMNTNTSIRTFGRRFLVLFLSLCLILPGAALADGKNGKKNFKEGVKYEEQQQWDMAAQHFALALSAEPNNPEYKLHYLRALNQASLMYVKRGDALAEQNDYASAYTAYRQAYNYDQGNEIARFKMERMLELQKAQASGESDQFKYNIQTGAIKPVTNDIQIASKGRSRGDVAQTINFKDTSFKAAVNSLSRQLGLNVVFDDTVKDSDKVTIDLTDVTLAKALDIVLMQKKHTFEQVDRRTIFVYPDNGTNRPRFEKHMIKTFYLNNINANTAKAVLAQMLPPGRQIASVDTVGGQGGASNSNVIVVKATPAELQLVQDLLVNIDKNKNEVVLDIEIYEVSHDSLLQIGNQLVTSPVDVIEQRFDKDGKPVSVVTSKSSSLTNLGGIGLNRINSVAGNSIAGNVFTPFLGGLGTLIGLPPTQLSLLQSRGQSKLLHKTQIHVLDGGQNQTKVGRSVPVRLGTSYGYGGGYGGLGGGLGQTGIGGTGVQGVGNTALGNALGTLGGLGGFGGGFGYPGIDSIQYRDVGLVIKAQPQITNEGYVEVKMEFETSDVVASGADATNLTPIFTQRSLNTVARIQDGVTSVVAGVNQETKGDSRAGIPVLGMLPLIGRLFTTPRQESRQSDVIITVTPHIIRSAGVTKENYYALAGAPQQGSLNQSIEDVVNRAQIEEEQERRLIAEKMSPGVPLDAPAQAPGPQNQNAGFGGSQRNASQPSIQNTNNSGNRRVINNQTVGPPPPPSYNPAANVPEVPESQQQPEVQITPSGNNNGVGIPQQQPGQPGQGAGQQGAPPEVSSLVDQPTEPVAQATVVSSRRPEHVERAIAKMLAEERARKTAEAANKTKKPEPAPQYEIPKEYMIQSPQQKVAPAALKTVGGARANSAANFSLSPKPIRQQIGKTFMVTVEVSSQEQMSGASIALRYDASKLQVKSVRDGGLFGAQPEFSYDLKQKGVLVVNVKQPQNTPTASSGRLITIEFSAIGEGQSEIAFNSNDTKVRVGSAQIPAAGSATQVFIGRDSVTTSNEK